MITIGMLILGSCRKKMDDPRPDPSSVDLSNQQARVAALTREVARALEEVYKNNRACNEVNAAIHCGYYEDERVLLKDLLKPTTSDLYKSSAFRKLNVDTGIFRRKFCEIIERGNYPLISAALSPAIFSKTPAGTTVTNNSLIPSGDDVGILSGTQLISIYFPYSENFGFSFISDSLPPDNKFAIILRPTIVSTDRESDSAPGRDPIWSLGSPGNVSYIDVTVDDSYAEKTRTHIIGIGAKIKETTQAVYSKSEMVYRVYNGANRLTKQFDRLISFTGNGGGSEIKVCRINAYLKRSDEQVTDFSGDVVSISFTRADIRNKRWKRIFSVWDPNWSYQDLEQIYAVYEDDNVGTKTIDGSLTTNLTIPGKAGKAEGSIGFKIQVMTQDEIVMQRKMDRKSFLRDGMNNQGWGFNVDADDFLPLNKDWPVIDGGSSWQYTLPYRIY
jgi:hypothetical protein